MSNTPLKAALKRSPWLLHYDASSCNGCDIETLACLTPLFDVERLGVINTGNPKQADLFLITGAVNEQSAQVIRTIYEQLSEPKVILAVGACASSGGIFRDCYNIAGGVDQVVPVDVYVPGCAARPEAIIDGVIQALEVLEKRRHLLATLGNTFDELFCLRAGPEDAEELLALQKTALTAELASPASQEAPEAEQTLEDLRHEFERHPAREVQLLGARGLNGNPEESDRVIFLKAVLNGKIIGFIQGFALEQTAFLREVVVHPFFEGRGISRRLISELERAFPQARWLEARVWQQSRHGQQRFETQGYQLFKAEPFNPHLTALTLQRQPALTGHPAEPARLAEALKP